MSSSPISIISVKQAASQNKHKGLLTYNNHALPCLLGANGISTLKQEGDLRTPVGTFRLLYGFYRKDRTGLIRSELPLIEIKENMGWCDYPSNANYNRPVKLPFNASHEKLYRSDELYDICLVMDHNYSSRIRNRGSAVFFHLESLKRGPTHGCIAITRDKMLKILPRLTSSTLIQIKN